MGTFPRELILNRENIFVPDHSMLCRPTVRVKNPFFDSQESRAGDCGNYCMTHSMEVNGKQSLKTHAMK